MTRMTYDELLSEALKLSDEDQGRFKRDFVFKSCSRRRDDDCFESYGRYCRAMTSLLDSYGICVRLEDISSRNKTYPLPYARRVIFKVMREDGFSLNQIGKASGFNHSTIHVVVSSLKDTLESPIYDPFTFRLYNDFIKLIKDYEKD